MLELFLKGGPLMWTILLCSIISVAITLDRFYYFYRSRTSVPNISSRVKSLLKDGKTEDALKFCEKTSGPVARIMGIGIHIRHRNPEEREKMISRAGSKIIRELDKNLGGLAVIVNVATLIGLLGTVTGMINAFMKIQDVGGKVDASILAGGIWEALITTAAGLFVAIPTLIAYHYFEGRVDDISGQMKDAVSEVLEI